MQCSSYQQQASQVPSSQPPDLPSHPAPLGFLFKTVRPF